MQRKHFRVSVQQTNLFINYDFSMIVLLLILRRDLNEASLLWNLKIRYDKELIYVSILIHEVPVTAK